MKMSKIYNIMDEAINSLLYVHTAMKEEVDSSNGAKVIALVMMPALDTLSCCLENLPKNRKGKKVDRKVRLPAARLD